MPLAYDIHPEFGYLWPGPRVRRELRVAAVSMLLGMAIGAAIVTIRASQAVETDGVSSNSHLKSSGPDTLLPGVAGRSFQFKSADNGKADPAEADQAVSNANGASAPEKVCFTHCQDSARRCCATGARYCISVRGSGVARRCRGSGVAGGFTASAIIRSNRRARRHQNQEAAKDHACETSAGRRG